MPASFLFHPAPCQQFISGHKAEQRSISGGPGSSAQQYNQTQEAHLICHVHTEGKAKRGSSPPALADMDIPQQEPAGGGGGRKTKKRIAVGSAGALLYSQGLLGRLSHAKPTSSCPLGERWTAGSRPARGQWQPAACHPTARWQVPARPAGRGAQRLSPAQPLRLGRLGTAAVRPGWGETILSCLLEEPRCIYLGNLGPAVVSYGQ